MNDLVTIKNELETTISDFNEPFTNYLTNLGLPITGILAPISARQTVINSIESEINKISKDNRQYAIYLTRFLSSVAAGLFDGAVAYLWNETIKSLQKMVASYDLDYFIKVTSEINNRYHNIKTEEDLSLIADYDLLNTCNRMGLITDHVFEVFKFINYVRNHSSATHPTENEIGAYDLLSWLENCIRYAINAEPNGDAIKLKQLLYNIRANNIPEDDLSYIGTNINNLPTIIINIWHVYRSHYFCKYITKHYRNCQIYLGCKLRTKKHLIGEKYGYFRKNGDIQRKEKANEFLILVDGLSYKDEDSISYEIRDTLTNLMTTHNSINNFITKHLGPDSSNNYFQILAQFQIPFYLTG